MPQKNGGSASKRLAVAPLAGSLVPGPEQAGGDTAPGSPGLRQLIQRAGAGALSQGESITHRILQGNVAAGKDVRMTGAEEKVDIRRPTADALDLA